MIIKEEAAIARLNSPMNLINRLASVKKTNGSMSLFIRPQPAAEKTVDIKAEEEVKVRVPITTSFNPFEQKEVVAIIKAPPKEEEHPSIDNLINNSDNQIKLAEAHDSALSVLTTATKLMAQKLDDIKADKLPSVIAATSKVVESIRRERNEAARQCAGKEVHYHFYTPVQKKVADYEVIEVG